MSAITFLMGFAGLATQSFPQSRAAILRTGVARDITDSSYLTKINVHLRKTLADMVSSGVTRENASTKDVKRRFSTPIVDVDDDGSFHSYVRLKSMDDSTIAQIRSIGIIIEHMNVSWRRLVTRVPFDRVELLSTLNVVTGIDNVDRPFRFTGDVTTNGDGVLQAAEARNTFTVNGSGITVGVISDGVDSWQYSISSGDLPSDVEIINNRIGGNEGTAMLEIVHDIAPGSNLAFADPGLSQEGFADNIDNLRNYGADIIVDDIAYLAEPEFEDGVIAQRVENAVSNGVTYVAAAGNHGDRTWGGQFSDNDGDGWHEFQGGNETNAISFSTALDKILVTLQWANKWGLAGDDYNLYLCDASGNIVEKSDDVQDGEGNPYEVLFYWNDNQPVEKTLYLKVKKRYGSARELKLLVWVYGGSPSTIQYRTNYGLSHHQGASSCISVGAVPWDDPQYVEYFSSHGPTRIYSYDLQGRPVSFFDRATPSQVATDKVDTKTGLLGHFYNPFYGTSAAAPHVAGIAALVLSLNSQLSPAQVRSCLESTADKVQGMQGQSFTNEFGFGRTNALKSLAMGNGTPSAPQNVAITGSVGQHPTISWSANPEPDLSGYELYRKITPDESQFYLIASLGTSQTNYSDPDVTIRTGGTGGQWAQYCVKALDIVGLASSQSTIASKAVDYDPQKAYEGEDAPLVTSLRPTEFSIVQNYPNPFNPETDVMFGLPAHSRVKITISDVLGREVDVLVDGEMPMGFHRVRWSGKYANRQNAASGTYFCSIVAMGEDGKLSHGVTKMLLAR